MNPAKTKTSSHHRQRTANATKTVVAVIVALVGTTSATDDTSVHPTCTYVHSYDSSGVNLRSCASTSCGSYAYMPNFTAVATLCWEDTQWVYPPSSNYASRRWFKVSSPSGGGFVHSSLVANQSNVIPC
jgi:hypothetical protein